MGKIFFIGDSITTGAWDVHGGWTNRMIGSIMEKTMKSMENNNQFHCLPYNLGVSGDTVEDVLKRLEKEVVCRCDTESSDEAIQFVFALGINDSIYMVDENKPRYTDDAFLKNLNSLVSLSQKLAQKISFIGLNPVDDNLLNPVPWSLDKSYMNDRVKHFETLIANICTDNNLGFLPIHDQWMHLHDYKSYLIDGVHPNSQGHELLSKQIGDFIFDDQFEKFHSSYNI